MGRHLKIANSILRNLAMLRDEFMHLSGKHDLHHSRLTVQRSPLLTESGTADWRPLRIIEGWQAGPPDGSLPTWAENASDDSFYHEFNTPSRNLKDEHYGRIEEMAENALRSIASEPFLASRLKVSSNELSDDLAWSAYWCDVLIKLGLTQGHPIVRTARSHFRISHRHRETIYFLLGSRLISVSDAPAEVIGRLKRLARAPSRYEELKCGVLRGSAYAIDWLIYDASSRPR